MWEINSYSQYLCFLYSVLIGGIIGVIYDFFKIDRILFKRSILFIIFEDILFWVISAFIFYSFSIVFSNGQVRGYLLIGCLCGFFTYKLTVSRLIIMMIFPLKKLSVVIKKFYSRLLDNINSNIISIFKNIKAFSTKSLLKKWKFY